MPSPPAPPPPRPCHEREAEARARRPSQRSQARSSQVVSGGTVAAVAASMAHVGCNVASYAFLEASGRISHSVANIMPERLLPLPPGRLLPVPAAGRRRRSGPRRLPAGSPQPPAGFPPPLPPGALRLQNNPSRRPPPSSGASPDPCNCPASRPHLRPPVAHPQPGGPVRPVPTVPPEPPLLPPREAGGEADSSL
jgi:hypothetical protein